MKTPYAIYRPGHASPEQHEIDWPESPGYDRLKTLIEPLIDGEPLEHVTVLHDGKRRDMFVSELGQLQMATRGPLPRNDAATVIYRNNWITQHPKADPETLPWIAGTAILFERIVWT